MNVHINLDLGIAVAEISNENNIDDLESDFNKINEILSSLIEGVQNDLAGIWPRLLKILTYFKKVDDFMINFSMRLARDGAWRFAKSLVGKSGVEKENCIKERDSQVLGFSKRLTNYGLLVKVVFFIIRISERGTSSDKIKALENKLP